jgi:hypothetical protein
MANSQDLDPNRIAFLQGVLAALAASGQVVHYDEIRRLCRFSQQQLGEYLGAARSPMTAANQPDFCTVVVGETGWPGAGWGDPAAWAHALRRAHEYWRDRRSMDNADFRNKYGSEPEVPGLWK